MIYFNKSIWNISSLAIMICISACASSTGGTEDIYETQTGKKLVIKETHPIGMSLSHIKIQSEGFEHNFSETFKDQDPISNVMVADLDCNGFDEFYIITTSVGSGSYGNLIGLASNRDKSLSSIYLPEIKSNELFFGYSGHDLFSVEDNQLVRSFPVEQNIKHVFYKLLSGEAGWQLKIVTHSITDKTK